MSRTEDDARTGTSASRDPEKSGDGSTRSGSADSVEDGAVLPTSDWSVDDDPPAKIDPLLQRSKRSEDNSGETRRRRNTESRNNGRGRDKTRNNDDTGEVPVVETGRARRDDDSVTQPSVAVARGKTASQQRPAAKKEDATVEQRQVEQPRTEPIPTQQPATQPVPTQSGSGRTAIDDPRRWDVDDDFGPWPSHETVGAVNPTLFAPEPSAEAEPGRRVIRRTTRILRHVDPWSTFKVGLLFSAVGYLVTMTSGVLLWRVAERTGTLDNVERWFTQFGWETFDLEGSAIFTNAAIAGLFLAVGATGAMVMFATIFNLASDAIGGIRMTILEEQRVRQVDDDLYGHVDPSYGVAVDPHGDWGLGD